MATRAPIPSDPDRDDVDFEEPRAKELTEAEEQKMFREAIPAEAPELTEEELETLRKREPPAAAPESKDESSYELFGTPSEANLSESPFKYGGKLYFNKPDGRTYLGSAEFVGEYNILLTAAHCVRDNTTGTFYTNFIFYRAYKNGTYAKRFFVNAWGTKAGWVNPTPNRECAD